MRADLKDERGVVFLTESGRLFHNTGAEKEKARSSYVTEFTVGIVKRSLEDDQPYDQPYLNLAQSNLQLAAIVTRTFFFFSHGNHILSGMLSKHHYYFFFI